MSVIKIDVIDQKLVVKESPTIASQGVNEDYVEFTFDDVWSGMGKTALFYRDDDETVYQAVVNSENQALVPHEVTAKDGIIWFGVAGITGSTIYTSEVLPYKIVKGIYVSGEESKPISPDVYAQIMSTLGVMQSQLVELIVSGSLENQKITTLKKTVTVEDHSGIYTSAIASFTTADSAIIDGYEMLLGVYWEKEDGTMIYEEYSLSSLFPGYRVEIEDDSLSSGDQVTVSIILASAVPPNAELLDIRVGVDGTVYQTAGDAVRAQIEEAMSGGGEGTGWTSAEIALLETILKAAVYSSNQSGNITALINALSGGVEPEPPEPGTEDVTLENGVLTINATGAEISLVSGVLTIG